MKLTTILILGLVVGVLCAWGRAQLDNYQVVCFAFVEWPAPVYAMNKRMEHSPLNSVKVEPEGRPLQQQRDTDLSDTNRLLGAFLKHDIPTTKQVQSTSPRAYPTQPPVGQTVLGEEGRKQKPGKFMEAVNRMLAENNGQLLAENLEQQIKGQVEGPMTWGKPNEGGRIQTNVDVAVIQRIVREEVAKLKAAAPIDFAVELARHKEVIQQWMDEPVERRTAAETLWPFAMWIQGNLGWSLSVAATLAFTCGFLLGKLTTLLRYARIPVPDGKPALAAKTSESNNAQVGSPGSSSKSRNKKRSKAD
ncbi:hypothetical protein QOT17_012794 [Balamuthia mandrillaris]